MTNLRRLRTANPRRPRAAVAAHAHCRPQPAARSLPRRGISLLEVLISMFVLLFGLMGVAAIFPVGNHYAGRGEQFDRGSALTEAAFADLKARGMLKPEYWFYATKPNGFVGTANVFNFITNQAIYGDATSGTFNFDPWSAPNDPHPGYAFVIDPMGAAAGRAQTPALIPNHSFPGYDASAAGAPVVMPTTTPWTSLYGSEWPIRRITLLQAPNQFMSAPVANTIFRLRDDVTNELPKENDRPGIQRWNAVDNNATPTPNYAADDTLLARQYAGGYSWLATVVPTSTDSLLALQPTNSRFGSDLYEVSVAVFNKREVLPSAATERTITAQMLQGNELLIYDANVDNVDAAAEGIRAGNWIAVAGVHPTNGSFLMKWYRILSIDDETDEVTGPNPLRRLMLDGPDWPLNQTTLTADNLRAILLPGVISVSTQMLPMESAQ